MKRSISNWPRKGVFLGLGSALMMGALTVAFTPKATPILLEIDDTPVARDSGFATSFSPVVKKVVPSVVRVEVKARSQMSGQEIPGQMDNPWLRRFFDQIPNGGMNRRNFSPPQRQGVGSGVIVSENGYILTNNHVVDKAEEVKVILQDGREFDAKVVGTDPKTDVAVLRVDQEDLPAISIADSDNLEVGDVVLAVGNPFGIGQTVTMGMVSAMGRAHMGLDYEDFIQTDAAINPGNSGGALVDTEGRLVGINTAILSRSGGNQGIGFAIPTNLARSVMEELVADGKVTRGYLGVMIQDLNPALAEQFELTGKGGALISQVDPNGPAADSDLQHGDVVLKWNGKQIKDSRSLKFAVADTDPGQKVPVTIWRDGAEETLKIKVAALPGSAELASNNASAGEDVGTLNGVGVTDLDRNQRRQLQVPDSVNGVLVTDVDPGSAAAKAGLRPGDIIQEINRQTVTDAQEAVALTKNSDKPKTLLRVWTNNGSHYLLVDETKQS